MEDLSTRKHSLLTEKFISNQKKSDEVINAFIMILGHKILIFMLNFFNFKTLNVLKRRKYEFIEKPSGFYAG